MIYLHIIFGILLTGTGISCLYQYHKAPPTTGHVIVIFHTLVLIAMIVIYVDIYAMMLRMANQ